jgi:hypothetical protein
MAIHRREIDDPKLWYFYRWAKGNHNDLATKADRIAAVDEATGPVGEYGPGQFDDIASQWDRKGADLPYLERVWLNRWIRSHEQAFDPNLRDPSFAGNLLVDDPIRDGSFVTAGFDGARRRDSTGIVITDIATGRQQAWAVWEKDPDDPNWEIDEDEVTQAVDDLHQRMRVWRFNGDPPYWTETMGSWAGKYESVEEWWTNRIKVMAYAVRRYDEALADRAVTFVKNHPLEPVFARHMAAAGKVKVPFFDDQDQQLHILGKLHPDRKFDLQMAAILSWEARLEALKKGAEPPKRRSTKVKRLR